MLSLKTRDYLTMRSINFNNVIKSVFERAFRIRFENDEIAFLIFRVEMQEFSTGIYRRKTAWITIFEELKKKKEKLIMTYHCGGHSTSPACVQGKSTIMIFPKLSLSLLPWRTLVTWELALVLPSFLQDNNTQLGSHCNVLYRNGNSTSVLSRTISGRKKTTKIMRVKK